MPDVLEIPEFVMPYGRIITVCGDVSDEEDLKDALELIGTDKPRIAVFGDGNALRYLRLDGPRTKRTGHLHIDVASPAHFPSPPKPNAEAEAIFELLAPFMGRKYTAQCIGGYNSPLSEIDVRNSPMRRLAINLHEDKFKITQVGSRLKLEGFPADEIEWSISGDQFRSEITMSQKVTIGPKFLMRVRDTLDIVYRFLIAGNAEELLVEGKQNELE